MATNEEILAEIEADWQEQQHKVLRWHVCRCASDLGKVIPEEEDYPQSIEELFDRNIDLDGICLQIQESFNKEIDDYSENYSCPATIDIKILILEWVVDDPALLLAVGSFPWTLERVREGKISHLNEIVRQIEKTFPSLETVSAHQSIPDMISSRISLSKAALSEALRRSCIYKKHLQDTRPKFSANDRKSGYPKRLKGKAAKHARKYLLNFDEEWNPLLEETHDFFVKHGAGREGFVSLSACRLTAELLRTLFPEIERFNSPTTENLASDIRNKIRRIRGEKKDTP